MSDQVDDDIKSDDVKTDDIAAADRPLAIPAELPVLPLRDTVLFPNSFMPLAVARERSRSRSRKISIRLAWRPTSTRCSSCPTAAFA